MSTQEAVKGLAKESAKASSLRNGPQNQEHLQSRNSAKKPNEEGNNLSLFLRIMPSQPSKQHLRRRLNRKCNRKRNQRTKSYKQHCFIFGVEASEAAPEAAPKWLPKRLRNRSSSPGKMTKNDKKKTRHFHAPPSKKAKVSTDQVTDKDVSTLSTFLTTASSSSNPNTARKSGTPL